MVEQNENGMEYRDAAPGAGTFRAQFKQRGPLLCRGLMGGPAGRTLHLPPD
jgi:hypothetical protein